ncbi:caspase Dronc [Anopheles bellator]|uniref:caspase Dronc n=1 Tax=Anopheles bellator TaxID=139047 RepID=UPI002648E10C|nr:caspase Dronc [Anopheles bellator]
MNHQDRIAINCSVEKLISMTKYCVLRDECLNKGMMSHLMVSRIEEVAQDETSRHKKLFDKITKRGPKAFNTLLDICQRHFPSAYVMLNPASNDNQMHSTHNTKRQRSISFNVLSRPNPLRSQGDVEDGKNNNLANSTLAEENKCTLEVYPDTLPDSFTVTLTTGPVQTHPKVAPYSMKSRNRGVVFIVNVIDFVKNVHPKRNGADIDGRNLISIFQQLGFVVFYYENITRSDLDELLVQLKESEYLSCDCFAFYILSHGDRKNGCDYIFLHDNSILLVEDLLTDFNTVNCARLVGKPKIFFISTCRGMQPDLGSYRLSTNTERDGINIKPLPTNIGTFCDMLVCYATVPGFAAHRDTNTGSWFVESMCKIWAEHAHDTDVETLMKLVGEYASTYRTESSSLQTICTEQRGFFRHLYLNPGYYEHPEVVVEVALSE